MTNPVKIPENLVDAWVNMPGKEEDTFEVEVPEAVQARGGEAVEDFVRHHGAKHAGVSPEDLQFTRNW